MQFALRALFRPKPIALLFIATVVLAGVAVVVWILRGESFLSPNLPLKGGVLVVEGWIGRVGVEAAAKIAVKENYTHVIAVGARTGNGWGGTENYAQLASHCLVESGVPAERVIEVGVPWASRYRTYASAVAVREAMKETNLLEQPITVFTSGAHGRRSWNVFRKAFIKNGTATVGIISWRRPEKLNSPWWQDSARARDLIGETVGWVYEFFWDSGRD